MNIKKRSTLLPRFTPTIYNADYCLRMFKELYGIHPGLEEENRSCTSCLRIFNVNFEPCVFLLKLQYLQNHVQALLLKVQ